MTDFIHFRVF